MYLLLVLEAGSTRGSGGQAVSPRGLSPCLAGGHLSHGLFPERAPLVSLWGSRSPPLTGSQSDWIGVNPKSLSFT